MARKPHPLVAELKAAREAAGMSAFEASRQAGLAGSVVRNWESGLCEPTVAALEKYLMLFGRRLIPVHEDEVPRLEAVRRLELEAIPERPSEVKPAPVTAEEAAENRRVLAEAMGFKDDMPLAPAAIVHEWVRRDAA